MNKPLQLNPEQDGILRKLYFQGRIPRDQYKRRPEDLAALVDRFNELAGLHEDGEQIIRYIKNQQKATSRLEVPWPTFKGAHKRAPALSDQLNDKQLAALRDIYETVVIPLGIGVDLVEADSEICNTIAKQFAKRTGVILPGLTLLSIAEEKRKRGLWFKVGKRDGAWSDLDQVARLKDAAGSDSDEKKKGRKPKPK